MNSWTIRISKSLDIVKTISLTCALGASVMLLFGGVWWSIGVSVVSISICLRFLVSLLPMQHRVTRRKLDKIPSWERRAQEVLQELIGESLRKGGYLSYKAQEAYEEAQKAAAEAMEAAKTGELTKEVEAARAAEEWRAAEKALAEMALNEEEMMQSSEERAPVSEFIRYIDAKSERKMSSTDKKIFEMISSGLTRKEIAEKLSINENQVFYHISKLREILKASLK